MGHHPVDAQQTFEGDWELLVKADGKELLKTIVGKEAAKDSWMEIVVDLTDYAGKTVKLELVNQSNNWAWEAAYWGKIKLISK